MITTLFGSTPAGGVPPELIVAVTLVLALAGILAFTCFAINEWIDHRLHMEMSDAEWEEELEYRAFLRSTWFGGDRSVWLERRRRRNPDRR